MILVSIYLPTILSINKEERKLIMESLFNPMIELVRKDANLVVGRTFSKLFGLAGLRVGHTALYNEIKARLSEQRVVLPPSAAVAGIYARVDRERVVRILDRVGQHDDVGVDRVLVFRR